ncbi:MAG: amidohydrolase family protein [Myxococcota bacterium]|nr:amidohydrolase family protein [Myxococcota bacterium]
MIEGAVREITERAVARGGFVNAHSHLDIAWVASLPITAEFAREAGLGSSYELAQLPLRQKIEFLDVRLRRDPAVLDSLRPRMERTLEALERSHGRACRTCITVGSELDPAALDVAGEVKQAWGGRVALQVSALHLRGILDDDAERAVFERACRHPAVDAIGGLPQVGCSDLEKYYELLFELSQATGKPLEVHTDELLEPGEQETGVFAAVAKRHRARGYAQRLSVVHAAALSAQPPDERRRVSALLAEAEVAVVVCPRSALGMAGLDRATHLHNCIAPLHDLLAEGVLVALGTDNINDVFVPFSQGDLIEELDFLAEAVRFYDLDALADIASRNGAEVLGL